MIKKTILTAAALLLALCLLMIATNWALPRLDNLENFAAVDTDGTLRLIENRRWQSRIYTADAKGHIIKLYKENRRGDGVTSAITQVAVSERGLYFIRQTYQEGEIHPVDWQLLRQDAKTGELLSLQGGRSTGAMRVTGLTVAYGEVLVAGVTERSNALLCTLPESGGEWLVASRDNSGNILDARADTYGLMLLQKDGRITRPTGNAPATQTEFYGTQLPDQLSQSGQVRILCKVPLLIAAVLSVLLLLLLFLLFVRFRSVKSLALRGTLLTSVCLLPAMLLVAATVIYSGSNLRSNVALDYATRLSHSRAELIGTGDPAAMLQPDFYVSNESARIQQILQEGDELYSLRDGELSVVFSARYPQGASPKVVLQAEDLALLESAKDGKAQNQLTVRQGRTMALCSDMVYSSGVATGVLLSRSMAEPGSETQSGFVRTIALLLLVLYLLTLFLHYLFLRRSTRLVSSLAEQMRAVSEGDLTVQDVPDERDELGDMALAMQEMCMGLAIRDYEVDALIHSYRRFIPNEMHQLLDRASVMEVSFGDAKTILGNVGLFSVCNQELARAELEDAAYVDFVSRCFSALHESTEEHGGRMLFSAFDLSAMPVLYPTGAVEALHAGLALLGERNAGKLVKLRTPDFFLMLHHTEFLYGIAGTKEQVFPFLSSQEMEFLGGFSTRFRDAGVRLVMTESFRQNLTVGCSMRYIGFLNSADERFSTKLYEVLDMYPDMERNLRLRYDRRLQEGIQYFYHNDFYLARNIFSALLKSCPQDGVVRWYLFACEHFFNSRPDQVDYSLFGIE